MARAPASRIAAAAVVTAVGVGVDENSTTWSRTRSRRGGSGARVDAGSHSGSATTARASAVVSETLCSGPSTWAWPSISIQTWWASSGSEPWANWKRLRCRGPTPASPSASYCCAIMSAARSMSAGTSV